MGCPPVEVVGVAVLVRGGQSIQRFRQLIKVGLVAGEAGDIPRLPSVGAVANASKAVPCLALPAIMLRRPLGRTRHGTRAAVVSAKFLAVVQSRTGAGRR